MFHVAIGQLLAYSSVPLWYLLQANGFYGGAGVSGYIPCAYTYIAKAFDEQVRSTGQAGRIHLYEYTRAGWTFHGKGLWCYLPGQHWPSFTLVGSPNFGVYSFPIIFACLYSIIFYNHVFYRFQVYLS